MSYVLVLADHVDGVVKKVTFELLTLARTLGEPVVVLVGAGSSADDAVASLGEYGATRVFVADAPELTAHPVAPIVELLVRVAGDVVPAAILVASGSDGKEIAARLAAKLGSGVLTDVVAVSPELVATRRWHRRAEPGQCRHTGHHGSPEQHRTRSRVRNGRARRRQR
jgi:electron transfer flavoprotein alpha subunit